MIIFDWRIFIPQMGHLRVTTEFIQTSFLYLSAILFRIKTGYQIDKKNFKSLNVVNFQVRKVFKVS